MKKLIALMAAMAALLLTAACSTGSHTVVSGREDAASLVVLSERVMNVTVEVDGAQYTVKSIATRRWKVNRNVRKTVENSVDLSTGRHKVRVSDASGRALYDKEIFVSAGETKEIQL